MFGGPSGKLPGSASSHSFSQIPRANIPRSAFDRSWTHKTTLQASQLVPILIDEVIPGDTVACNATLFARMLTSVVPAMDNLVMDTQFFFIPQRLVWSNSEKFFGAQDNPGDSISFTVPQMGPAFSFAVMTLPDYFGIGTGAAANVGGTAGELSALPFRAYNRVWNEWYRDENLQNSVTLNMGNGPDAITDYTLLQRGKRKDYFYGSLPFLQKGTAVSLPLGTSAPVTRVSNAPTWKVYLQGTNTLATTNNLLINATGGLTTPAVNDYSLDPVGGLIADLSTAAAATINALRQAFQIQSFLEKDARGGTRYIELVLSHFGVVNPDFRLQRTEFLGGGSTEINSNPVPQTTPTGIAGTSTKFGDLSAFSTALGTRNGFTKSFTEHGFILGLVSVRVKAQIYQQGIDRMWQRSTRYDYYWPVFAQLGEQAVYGKEIYYLGDKAAANTDASVWGYQERYAEYRYKPSKVSGLFRSIAASTLDSWHFAQNYGTRPTLAGNIADDTINMLDRNLAVTHSATVAQFKLDCYFDYKWARAMPVNGVPYNMSRF